MALCPLVLHSQSKRVVTHASPKQPLWSLSLDQFYSLIGLKQSSGYQLKQVLPKFESPSFELPQEELGVGELSPPHATRDRLNPKAIDIKMIFMASLCSCNS
jgi:hypothetical protein